MKLSIACHRQTCSVSSIRQNSNNNTSVHYRRPSVAEHITARRTWRCREVHANSTSTDKDEAAEVSSSPATEEDTPMEDLLRKNKKKKRKGPKVVAPVVDKVYGGRPLTVESQAESAALTLLTIIFSTIILQGIFLAGSGFLPESWDQFAQDVVYKTFSPTLGVFLAGSTVYGLWKSRSGGS